MFQNITSEAIVANGTAIAGCSRATSLARVMLLISLRSAAFHNPVVTIRCVIDDVSFQALGGPATVSEQLPRAFESVASSVQSRGLPISWNKAGFLASSASLSEELAGRWALGPESRSLVHRDLGGDASDGRFRRCGTQLDRYQDSLRRARRLRILQSGGAVIAPVHRAGPTAVAMWGASITGVPDGRLTTLRVQAAKAEARLPKGASLGLSLAASRAGWRRDPLVITTFDSLKVFLQIVWDRHLTSTVVSSLIEQAHVQAAKPRPWVSCTDPVQALVLTLQRVG